MTIAKVGKSADEAALKKSDNALVKKCFSKNPNEITRKSKIQKLV